MKRTCCLGPTCSHPDDATDSWAVAGGRLSALSSRRVALPSRVSSSCPVPARLAAATHLLHRASCSSPRAIATGHCPALLLGAHAVLRTCLENRLMGCDIYQLDLRGPSGYWLAESSLFFFFFW